MTQRGLKRLVGGVVAEKSGRDFEDLLAAAHDAYEDHGIAKMSRLPVPTRSAGGATRVLVERQSYDFFGFFGPNAGPTNDPGAYHGRAIAMEAKRASSHAASMLIVAKGDKNPGIKEHQLESLAQAYLEFGVTAVVVWRNADQGLVLLPDRVLAAWEAFGQGRHRIPLSDFTPYETGISYPRHSRVDDWLFTVRCWLEQGGAPSPGLSPRKVYQMIKYTINSLERSITVLDSDNGGRTPIKKIEKVDVMDRQLIEQFARECTSVAEFETKVKGLQIAHS